MAERMMTSSMTSRDLKGQGRDLNIFKAHGFATRSTYLVRHRAHIQFGRVFFRKSIG